MEKSKLLLIKGTDPNLESDKEKNSQPVVQPTADSTEKGSELPENQNPQSEVPNSANNSQNQGTNSVPPTNQNPPSQPSNQPTEIRGTGTPPPPTTPMKKKKSKLSTLLWILVAVLLFFLIIGIIFGSRIEYVSYDVFFNTYKDASTMTSQPTIYLDTNNGYFVEAYFSYDGTTYVAYFDNIFLFFFFANLYGLNSNNMTWQPINPQPSFFTYLFLSLLPWILFFLIAWLIIKKIVERQQSTGKIQKKSLIPQISNLTFKDVEGYAEIKQELLEIVDFLRNPVKYQEAGARTPKGVLLSGPPGTGKTLFAKAIAGESSVPFYSISGSDFVEMFVGVGASRVRSLFEQAKKTSPSLVFIDELDAVGRVRGAGQGGGNDEREQTLNQLLVEMDGFQSNTGIIIIAATNRADILDPALKRPGRFDRSIDIRLPDIAEREAILKLHARKGRKVISSEIDWTNIASRTPGFSGAELENVINEAAILSVRLGQREITLEIIDESIDRVIGGPAKINNVMSKEEKELIAHHEAGHALIGLKLKDAEKVQKISIVPRGQAGGYVLMIPKKEKIIQTKNELKARIISYMGGRASEEIFFGKDEVTTGAYSDIQEATVIARRMITEFGMSEKLGPVQLDKPEGMYYLRNSIDRSHSEKVAYEIDLEIKKLIEDSYKKAYILISENKDMIKLFAKALMIKEVLNIEEINYIYENKKLPDLVLEMEENLKKSEKHKAASSHAK